MGAFWCPRKLQQGRVATAQQLFCVQSKCSDAWEEEEDSDTSYIFFLRVFICIILGQQSRQLCSTIAETRFSYSRLFSWYSWAAWLFAGLLGFGSSNRDCSKKKWFQFLVRGFADFCSNYLKKSCGRVLQLIPAHQALRQASIPHVLDLKENKKPPCSYCYQTNTTPF